MDGRSDPISQVPFHSAKSDGISWHSQVVLNEYHAAGLPLPRLNSRNPLGVTHVYRVWIHWTTP